MDVHCCNCHSGFLFDADSCVCEAADARSQPPEVLRQRLLVRANELQAMADDIDRRPWNTHTKANIGYNLRFYATKLRDDAEAVAAVMPDARSRPLSPPPQFFWVLEMLNEGRP